MNPFILHTISSIVSALLIIYLSLSCRFNKLGYHKEVSIVMAISGITSLIASLLYGFTLEFNFDLIQIHYYTGFLSLILSLLPFFRYLTKTSKWHYCVGDFAAVFAFISLITGFINYWAVLFPSVTASSCLTIEQMQIDTRCLVAVDGVVYDMTGMPRWQSGTHFDYTCGNSYYNITSIVPTHVADKYYGPVIGELC